MNTKLVASGYRVSALIETIVTSPQFLNRRTRCRTGRKASELMALVNPSNGASRRGCHDGLPWLESLSAFAATPRRRAAFPKRFAVLFMGNGINENHWGAEGSGAAMKLSKSLSPLEPLKKKINVINGLFNKHATGQGIHPAQTGSLLSGAPLRRGAVIHSGISVDQMIANRIGQETLQSSIVLACEQPMTGYHETNFSMAYSSHISWQNADSPVPNEVYPSLAFDTLFENRGSLRNLSILDRVRDDAQSLSRQISSTDKEKLDEYLTSVREVEKRIEAMRKSKDKAEDLAKLKNRPALSMERPANGLPEDLREHTRLMCDIIAMAFQTDKTRVASLLLARDLSALYYPFLDVRDGHHARLAQQPVGRLRAHRALPSEPDGLPGHEARRDARRRRHRARQLLPHVPLQPVGRAASTTSSRLPVVLAGGLGGTLETGRSLDYLDAGDDNRKMCSLYLGDHGPHGHQARSLRRRRHAPGEFLATG